jgi:hypothetical protein
VDGDIMSAGQFGDIEGLKRKGWTERIVGLDEIEMYSERLKIHCYFRKKALSSVEIYASNQDGDRKDIEILGRRIVLPAKRAAIIAELGDPNSK